MASAMALILEVWLSLTVLSTPWIKAEGYHYLSLPSASRIKNLGTGNCNFSTDSFKFPTAKLLFKISKTFTL